MFNQPLTDNIAPMRSRTDRPHEALSSARSCLRPSGNWLRTQADHAAQVTGRGERIAADGCPTPIAIGGRST